MHFSGGPGVPLSNGGFSKHMLSGMKSNKKSGFALAEMAMSVAVLVVLAGFSVQMFVASNNANSRSYDLYKAMSYAISIIETVKGVPGPEALTEEDFEPGAAISISGQRVVIGLFFDASWSPISAERHKAEPLYSVKAEVTPSSSTGRQAEYRVYNIKVQVVRLLPYVLEKDANKEIVSIETTKCYTAFAR